MRRNYRFRLYPTAAQEAQLEAMLGAFCDLYNAALHERIVSHRLPGVRSTTTWSLLGFIPDRSPAPVRIV